MSNFKQDINLSFYYFPANGVCWSIPHRVLLSIWWESKHSLCELIIENDPHLQVHLQELFYLCSIQGTCSEIHRHPKVIMIKMGTLPPITVKPQLIKILQMDSRCKMHCARETRHVSFIARPSATWEWTSNLPRSFPSPTPGTVLAAV